MGKWGGSEVINVWTRGLRNQATTKMQGTIPCKKDHINDRGGVCMALVTYFIKLKSNFVWFGGGRKTFTML
jgi:hypothetical protein